MQMKNCVNALLKPLKSTESFLKRVSLQAAERLAICLSLNDRIKRIQTSLHSFFYISIAMSVFWMTQAADDIYDLDFLDATIMSVYFQFIVLLSIGHALRNMRLEDIDFDLYKEEPAT